MTFLFRKPPAKQEHESPAIQLGAIYVKRDLEGNPFQVTGYEPKEVKNGWVRYSYASKIHGRWESAFSLSCTVETFNQKVVFYCDK